MWSLFISLSQSIGMWFPFLVRGSYVTKISNQKKAKAKANTFAQDVFNIIAT